MFVWFKRLIFAAALFAAVAWAEYYILIKIAPL